MSRRVLRLAVDLPDLSPVQAHLLCELFEELAGQIASAYERDIFDFKAERFHAIDNHHQVDSARETSQDSPTRPQANEDPDPDL